MFIRASKGRFIHKDKETKKMAHDDDEGRECSDGAANPRMQSTAANPRS